MHGDRYTRLVSLLKVLFPLTALAILSTLFLISRGTDPRSAIPFADKEIQDRLRDQQVTGPFFTGTTADGDQLSFYADTLATPTGVIGANRAEGVKARIETTSGARLGLQSTTAEFDIAKDRADLIGDVILTTSTGYRVVSDLLTSEISSLTIVSPGPVEATGPVGMIEAGSMEITTPPHGDTTQLIFTNRVKLVYTPHNIEE